MRVSRSIYLRGTLAARLLSRKYSTMPERHDAAGRTHLFDFVGDARLVQSTQPLPFRNIGTAFGIL